MNKHMLATPTILLFSLAITGYAYTRWQENLQIQGTANAKTGKAINFAALHRYKIGIHS